MLMNHLTKQSIRLLLGAAALSAALAGCQKAPEEVNPNFDPEKDQVSAAFVMSVSTGSRATKMTAANVQRNDNFLGIDNAKLFLYATGIQPGAPFVRSTDGTNFKESYELGAVLTPGEIDGGAGNAEKSNRVMQLTLPLGADAALFYGKATRGSVTAPMTVERAQGKMDFSNINQDPANTWFGPTRRIGDDAKVTSYDATGRLMIYAINTIMHTGISAADSYTCSNNSVEYTNLPALDWPTLGHRWEGKTGNPNPYGRPEYTGNMAPLEVSMGQAYAIFTHINTTNGFNEYRAGSSTAVKAMMKDLYSVISNTAAAKPLNDAEANVVRLAEAIVTNVNKFFASTWNYQPKATLQANIPEADWTAGGFSNAGDLNGYPYQDFGIPEGAAQLAFDSDDDMFSYTNPNKALVTPGKTFDPRKYVYAPELVYYVNSPLYVTSKSDLSVSDFPNGTTAWNQPANQGKWNSGGWTIDRISSNTRGVAIRDNINYGVALLQTRVIYSAAATSTGLNDNRHAMTGEDDRSFSIDDAHFTLRGVLIGGVHPRYNWQFIPRALTDSEAAEYVPGSATIKKFGVFDGVIYDDAIPATAVPTPEATPNFTLVYDNYDYTKADNVTQNDVYIALEFVNGGDAFWGRDNLIPAGGVFYLGAKLSAAPKQLADPESDQTITWPTDHQIPPINETTGASKQIPRVFIQDFLTKATFKIGENSLKYAYYNVPNLESSQMSFGLSVDLSWQSGYEYEIEFGNNPGPGN